MYCGATDRNLSEEHIVPLGLGGVWVLRKASCGNCRDITSKFESDVLRNTLLPARAKLKLPTRHKGGLPNELPITVGKTGQQETIQLPVDQHPTVLFLPRFKLPAYIDGRDYKAGIEVQGMYIYQLGPPSPQDFAKESNFDNLTYTSTFNSLSGGFGFARLLAKIAYGFAVAEFGSGIIRDTYVLPSILGRTDDVGKWVGCAGESSDTTNKLHDIKIGVRNSQIYVWIRLFAMLRGATPEYLVVVGQAPAH
jgi:hypothetical protein